MPSENNEENNKPNLNDIKNLENIWSFLKIYNKDVKADEIVKDDTFKKPLPLLKKDIKFQFNANTPRYYRLYQNRQNTQLSLGITKELAGNDSALWPARVCQEKRLHIFVDQQIKMQLVR